MAVTWRGVTLDERSAAMMDEVARLCPGTPVQPSQGSWSTSVGASAGTHSGPGAIDIKARDLNPAQRSAVETAMRQVGWAAWIRSPQQGNWPWHIHGIAVGCPGLPSSAANQVRQYLDGTNGLANHGPDRGNRQYVGVTWETYNGGAPGTTAPGTTAPDTLSMEDDMFMLQAPGRGVGLFGSGIHRWCDEETRDVLLGIGLQLKGVSDREYDVVRAAVLQGENVVQDD